MKTISERYRRSKKNGIKIKFRQERRQSKRISQILDLLAEKADWMLTQEIITTLDSDKKVYIEGKLNRKSTTYKSWIRTLSNMAKRGAILRKTDSTTRETMWKTAS